MVAGLHLPPSVTVQWDPSLEKKEVQVTIRVGRTETWSKAVDHIVGDRVEAQLGAILEEL